MPYDHRTDHDNERRRVIALRFPTNGERSLTYEEIEEETGVPHSTVWRWCKREERDAYWEDRTPGVGGLWGRDEDEEWEDLEEEDGEAGPGEDDPPGQHWRVAGQSVSDPAPSPAAARRHPAYDADTMAVVQHRFFWRQATRRVIGLPYAKQDPWPVLVVLGVGDDGHVHLFWEDNSPRNGMAIANNIQELHTGAPVDAVVHTPPQAEVHFRIARDLQNWQPLGKPPQDKFPLNPHIPGADLRPHLTRRLEAGRFTLHTTLCPKTHAELQADAMPADHPHPDGSFVLALCTVLEYLDQEAAA